MRGIPNNFFNLQKYTLLSTASNHGDALDRNYKIAPLSRSDPLPVIKRVELH